MTPLQLTLRNTEPISGDVTKMLAGAVQHATATEALVLIPLIAKAREVHDSLRALIAATNDERAS